jgi:hypothetical protein
MKKPSPLPPGVFLAASLVVAACSSGSPGAAGPDPQASGGAAAAAAAAIGELQEGRFTSARTEADRVLEADSANAWAHAVRAVADYRAAGHTLHLAFLAAFDALVDSGGRAGLDAFREALDRTEQALGKIEDDLAAASDEPAFALELCLACWRADWNLSGEIDESDRRLFEIEVDADLRPLPERDPRRRPTFRFDRGDVFWARAMVAFQRALLDLALAYAWDDLLRMMIDEGGGEEATFTLPLADAERVHRARELILAGLDHADRARTEYLAETDDDREWVPNPAQRDHPLPLPVDRALYDTWERVVRDVRRLVQGEEGIDVGQVAQLGDDRWDDPPRGFIDVGRLLEEPGDIVLSAPHIAAFEDEPSRANAEAILRDLFGAAFVPEMDASPLPEELARMKDEIASGAESFEHKLRYLLWIN